MQAGLARLVGIFGFVGASMKEPAHQAVSMLANVANAAHHAPQGDAQQHQRVRGEHQARLEGLGHHLRRARGDELVHVRVVQSADDHRQGRIERAHMMQNPKGELRIHEGNDERARARDTCRHERFVP